MFHVKHLPFSVVFLQNVSRETQKTARKKRKAPRAARQFERTRRQTVGKPRKTNDLSRRQVTKRQGKQPRADAAPSFC